MSKIRHLGTELDAGQKQIDENLSNLEDRLSEVYKEAADKVQSSLDSYLESYKARDEEMRRKVETGLIYESEYIQWRENTILRTRQMEAQVASLTQDMVNADAIAIQMINDELPVVYASSYNFGIYRASTQMDMYGIYTNASFSLYNADALKIIETKNPDLIPWDKNKMDKAKDKAWNRKHIQNALTQGILQGDTIPQLSKRLLPLVNMDENASRRTARTSYTSIQNQARRDATQAVRDEGIQMDEPWMSVLQENTRDTHLLLHGTLPDKNGLYGVGIIRTPLKYPADPDGDPEEIYNCQCRVQSFIHGIDHSKDDELYAQMMSEQHYEDWLSVQHYREDETREALERRERLQNERKEGK